MLIYLNKSEIQIPGTATLKHKYLGFETHPQTKEHKKALLDEANQKEQWEITYQCPEKYNRAFILNSDLIHAAMTNMDQRVMTVVWC